MHADSTTATAPELAVPEDHAHGAGAKLVRAVAHVAAWSPFLVTVADSVRYGWNAVGDGALIALGSWVTFSRHISLLGQPTEVHRGLHDLGPAEYWLLAAPVRLDPARGLLWGAALLCMVATSVAIEAAWSVLGEVGGLLASGVILAMIAWMPALALRPYWNPYFGAIWFLAALATGWAVLAGHRGWWPGLVVSASIAAQAHLMFAVASAALALVALVVAVADASRAKTGYRWAIVGLFAGEACWIAPIVQQVTNSPGNMLVLIRAEHTGPHAGPAFGLRAITAFTEPPPLWWRRHLGQSTSLFRMIEGRPAGFAVAVLVIMVAVLILARVKLGSRWLASLAAVGLLASTAAAVTFSGVPPTGPEVVRLQYLILVLFPAGLLIWLTAGSAVVIAGRQFLASRRPAAGRSRLAGYGVLAVAAALAVLASLHGLTQVSGYIGAGQNSDQIGVAVQRIERSVPGRSTLTLSVAADSQPDRYRVSMGLLWALTAKGYQATISRLGPARPIPHVTVVVTGGRVTVEIAPASRR